MTSRASEFLFCRPAYSHKLSGKGGSQAGSQQAEHATDREAPSGGREEMTAATLVAAVVHDACCVGRKDTILLSSYM